MLSCVEEKDSLLHALYVAISLYGIKKDGFVTKGSDNAVAQFAPPSIIKLARLYEKNNENDDSVFKLQLMKRNSSILMLICPVSRGFFLFNHYHFK